MDWRFNPRSRTRSDCIGNEWRQVRIVSIHAPVQGATVVAEVDPDTVGFQSTLPYKERQLPPYFLTTSASFNPRSRTRSDIGRFTCEGCGNVSIHAPVQGATCIFLLQCLARSVSIHAPVQGATSAAWEVILSITFQSTLPYKERLYVKRQDCSAASFNPRSRTWSDKEIINLETGTTLFQSTLPYKERQALPVLPRSDKVFQSTLPYKERLGYVPTLT